MKNWEIPEPSILTNPAKLAKAESAGLMPFDPAFLFSASDCIRTRATAYSKDGGLAILYGQLAPQGSVVKTAGISDEFKKYCGEKFVFEGPCVIFESQEDACAGILGGKVKAGDVVIIRNEGPRRAGPACRKCSARPATSPAWASATRSR
jgi:dihydroxyacid dehydratase/phosphogluconate dehydratase